MVDRGIGPRGAIAKVGGVDTIEIELQIESVCGVQQHIGPAKQCGGFALLKDLLFQARQLRRNNRACGLRLKPRPVWNVEKVLLHAGIVEGAIALDRAAQGAAKLVLASVERVAKCIC